MKEVAVIGGGMTLFRRHLKETGKELSYLATKMAMEDAGIEFNDLHYVASTNRPGLIGSLLIALQTAKAMSYTLNIPLIAINHLEAHLYTPFLEGREIVFPFIGLLISGGNTALYIVKGIGRLETLGKTADDAVGEAFDKVSKFLDLGYPGGPVIEKLARTAKNRRMIFPKILSDSRKGDYRFSYSGLKTAVINYIKEHPSTDKAEIVFSFQERALELLVRRVFTAARTFNVKNIFLLIFLLFYSLFIYMLEDNVFTFCSYVC